MALQAEISTTTGGEAGLLGLVPKGVFARRLERARERMRAAGIDVLVATPGTHFYWLTGITAFRSERLIALALPRDGDAVVVCPKFEEDNVRSTSGVADVRTWGETDDPYALLDGVLATGGRGTVGIEPTTWFETTEKLGQRFPGYKLASAEDVLVPLRMRKEPEELERMRAAIRLTQEKIRRGWAGLRAGVTELGFAKPMGWDWVLSQFGATSAIPHAHGGDVKLEPEMAVLTDAGNNDGGYASDITRSTWFGKSPSDEYRKVWSIVREAQEAGFRAARPGVACEEVDRAARQVIAAAGYGEFFTHRTGHGLGLDVHEHPYMVGGNALLLEPGMTFTIEPGIYLPGKFGVRIEDDFVITESGCESLSARVDRLEPLSAA